MSYTLEVISLSDFASILGLPEDQIFTPEAVPELKRSAVEKIKSQLIHPLRIVELPEPEIIVNFYTDHEPVEPFYSSPLKTREKIVISPDVALAYFEYFVIGGIPRILPENNPFRNDYLDTRRRIYLYFQIQYPEKYPDFPNRREILLRNQATETTKFEDNLMKEFGLRHDSETNQYRKISLIQKIYPLLHGIKSIDLNYTGSLFLERFFFENILRSGFEESRIEVLLWILSNHITGLDPDLFKSVFFNLEGVKDLSVLKFSFFKGAPDYYERQLRVQRPVLTYLWEQESEIQRENYFRSPKLRELGDVARGQQPTNMEAQYLVAYFTLAVNDFENLMAQYAAEFNAANL